jgi:hypothetical protein
MGSNIEPTDRWIATTDPAGLKRIVTTVDPKNKFKIRQIDARPFYPKVTRSAKPSAITSELLITVSNRSPKPGERVQVALTYPKDETVGNSESVLVSRWTGTEWPTFAQGEMHIVNENYALSKCHDGWWGKAPFARTAQQGLGRFNTAEGYGVKAGVPTKYALDVPGDLPLGTYLITIQSTGSRPAGAVVISVK